MRTLLLGLVVCLTGLAGIARAADTEPQVYFFYSATCSYSKAARTFLQKAQSQDPKLQVRDFEVEHNLPNALLLAKVYERIGLPGFGIVPLIVVGSNVVVGFVDEATTGKEILDHVAECRKTGCRDTMRDLVDEHRSFDEASMTGVSLKPVTCESAVQRRRVID